MDDSQIIDLYWKRQENAVPETKKKYGRYLFSIANHILAQYEDSEECVSDTLLGAWNSIPPHKPTVLSAYLGKITRRLEELSDCIPAEQTIDAQMDNRELAEVLNRFLSELPAPQRQAFVCRYWYCDSISEIAQRFSWSESKVKMLLLRTREKLRQYLKKEGIFI